MKLRMVSDASAKTTYGVYANECLVVGTKFQEDIFNIIFRFRSIKIGLSPDVAQMHGQVELNDKCPDSHRFFWLFSPKQIV